MIDTFSFLEGIYFHTGNLLKIYEIRFSPFYGVNALYYWENRDYERSQGVSAELDIGLSIDKINKGWIDFSFEMGTKFDLFQSAPYLGLKIKF